MVAIGDRKLSLKRQSSSPQSPREAKRQRTQKSVGASLLGKKKACTPQGINHRLRRAKEPAGKPWPVRSLNIFEPPVNLWGDDLLYDVLKSRGWRHRDDPCHGKWDEEKDISTLWIKEFEASVRGQTPKEAFGEKGAVQEGYKLKSKPLPPHALWMLGRLPYRAPGTANGRAAYRDDFVQIVVAHGANLPGENGNYRINNFPGTECAVSKTNLTKAFRDEPWYPLTYILPNEKDALLKKINALGDSRQNYWIAKPRNDFGGNGICVWKGTDQDLTRLAKESDSMPTRVVQRYLADPLLVGGYKFHMRIHMVITNLAPLQAYVQENGQCLFATKEYTLSNKTLGEKFDPPVHVTNLCLNATEKNKDNFLRKKPVIGKGQQIRMRQLVSYLTDKYPSFDKHRLYHQILNIAKEFARYIAKAPNVRRHGKLLHDRHFEIFGMDLMMDKNFKVWMCEVNNDPGLSYPDEKILERPNPDYNKELTACRETLNDLFTLLGLDSGRPQTEGSLRHWYELDFSSETRN